MKQQNSFFRELRRRCNYLVTAPERFPELYPDVGRRMPSLRRRRGLAKVMAEHCRMMDLESRRVGTPRADGSVYGLGEKNLAIRTGLGDPRTATEAGHWRGRRVVQNRVRELRVAGMLEWGRGDLIAKKRACNPRFEIKTGPKAGLWRMFPSVRAVADKFIERLALQVRRGKEIEDLQRRRAEGKVMPVVDVFRRRARDREIKARQRNKAREERLFVFERERTIAANQRTPRKNE
jgi:hypothetical protein